MRLELKLGGYRRFALTRLRRTVREPIGTDTALACPEPRVTFAYARPHTGV